MTEATLRLGGEDNHRKCLECGWEQEPGHYAQADWVIRFGGTTFTGCPNCFGQTLARLMGRTEFPPLVPATEADRGMVR